MRIFRHKCWFCWLKHKDVTFIVGDRVYQCNDREACQRRHDALAVWSVNERLLA